MFPNKKTIDAQFKQKIENIQKNADLSADEKESQLIALNETKDQELQELADDFNFTEKELRDLKELKIISELEYQDMSLKYGHVFEAGIGAEAVRKMLEKIDIDEMIKQLEAEVKDDNSQKSKKIVNRIKLLKSLKKNGIKPEHMVLASVPVIPPDLRPMVPLDGGRFATSDLNDLYRRVISRNNRLKRLMELNAPEVITRNEKRMLQEAVDALIDNSARHSKTTTASTGQKRKLKSIADYLKGKRGRFRQNLLGKRIDYSGRSVIVIGPSLAIDQCGIPKKMALELFKPFVISRLIKNEFVHNIRSANRFIESDRPEVWDILENIVAGANVLLNRAPTLHRLGIQAFQPVLIEGKAIRLHPLVCSAFNADFDGDQMAVHVPLTEEAKKEAKELMLSANNLLKPATGNPVTTPSMDMVWGSFYVTSIQKEEAPVKTFASINEAKVAHSLGKITLRQPLKIRIDEQAGELAEKFESGLAETTLGRILFNELLPAKLPYYNEVIDKKKMGAIVQLCLEFYGFEKTASVLDAIKNFGFAQLTKSGFSWGIGNLPDIKGKKELVEQGEKMVEEVQSQYEEGLLTADERYTKIIEIWTKIKDQTTQLSSESLDPEGPVYSMINSGARGSWGQLSQMLGMKGLVINPSGQIMELPVKANFKEGFQVLEYYISTHGTRKGLSDTALRTANAGYLTRRLVDVSQDIVIMEDDCGDTEGKLITAEESEIMGQKLADRVVGRYVVDPIIDPETKKEVVPAGEIITEQLAREMHKMDIKEVKIRSALSCKCKKGICRKCYGFDLAFNKPVEFGTAVGAIAAQSIGEPGTQLTMRTFHTGGVAGASDITQGLPRVEEVFEARPPKKKALIAEVEGLVSIEEQKRVIKSGKSEIVAKSSFSERILKINYKDTEEVEYKLPKDAKVEVKDGDLISQNDVLYLDAAKKKVKSKTFGKAKVEDDKISVITEVNGEKEYVVPAGTVLWVKDGDKVEKGQQLTEGSIDLSQLFKVSGKRAVQDYILREIQHIYSSQGQKLNDKHVEIIARQMFSRVYVNDAGDTDLLEGEVVERTAFLQANDALEKGQKPAKAEDVFLGISKVSLSTTSWLSAASFQETAKVLINAAVTGKIDNLEGLKENVIIGRLIPAGTGFRAKEKKEKAEA